MSASRLVRMGSELGRQRIVLLSLDCVGFFIYISIETRHVVVRLVLPIQNVLDLDDTGVFHESLDRYVQSVDFVDR